MKISINLKKKSMDSLNKKTDHKEDRISGPGDKVKELDHSLKENNILLI